MQVAPIKASRTISFVNAYLQRMTHVMNELCIRAEKTLLDAELHLDRTDRKLLLLEEKVRRGPGWSFETNSDQIFGMTDLISDMPMPCLILCSLLCSVRYYSLIVEFSFASSRMLIRGCRVPHLLRRLRSVRPSRLLPILQARPPLPHSCRSVYPKGL